MKRRYATAPEPRMHKSTDRVARFGAMCTTAQTNDRPWEYAASEVNVLSTIAIVLLGLWLLGVVTSYTVGGLIHLLLVVAVVMVLLRVVQGRNPLEG